MKKKNILYTAGLMAAMCASLSSCDSFLDEMPDNRTEIDTEDKVVSLITSAYPTSAYIMLNEYMSDNTDDMGVRYANYTDRLVDQMYAWKDITEEDNDSPYQLWQASYNAIASANQALTSIEEMGGATTTTLKEAKAEALLCRAYNHFILVNEFCMNYNTTTSATDLGVPYMTKPETTVNPHYERGTVAGVYEQIDKDIQEALPMIGDTHYTVPKYHFNMQAAYAFASRFYLFYEKWSEAARYANLCLGNNAKSMLRDWDEMQSYGETDNLTPRTNLYIDAADPSNLLLIGAISSAGVVASNYIVLTKYTHDKYLASSEDVNASNIWGDINYIRCRALNFQGGSMDRMFIARIPYLFEETDPVAQTGYRRTVYPAFKSDYLLLERAEAYIMMKEYDKACADLTTWMQNFTTSTMVLTPDKVVGYYKTMAYATWDNPTLKKHLHPAFAIDEEGSTQECMLQCVLNFKRIETGYEGLRWFDIKRYGINIVRRTMDSGGNPLEKTDSLTTNDLRRAIQLPQTVIRTGITANPR